jgi:hypothetical protein
LLVLGSGTATLLGIYSSRNRVWVIVPVRKRRKWEKKNRERGDLKRETVKKKKKKGELKRETVRKRGKGKKKKKKNQC